MLPVGLGNPNANLVVYIANIPPLDEFENISNIRSVREGEIRQIGELTGNHWRKIFNCYAKLCFEINTQSENTWQDLRDNQLLTESSNQLLLFSKPDLISKPELISNSDSGNKVRLICGKTYFNQLQREFNVEWIDDSFAVNEDQKLIVCPYFDYRQLNNNKIIQLSNLIKIMMQK